MLSRGYEIQHLASQINIDIQRALGLSFELLWPTFKLVNMDILLLDFLQFSHRGHFLAWLTQMHQFNQMEKNLTLFLLQYSPNVCIHWVLSERNQTSAPNNSAVCILYVERVQLLSAVRQTAQPLLSLWWSRSILSHLFYAASSCCMYWLQLPPIALLIQNETLNSSIRSWCEFVVQSLAI